jgi:hypothetical protein
LPHLKRLRRPGDESRRRAGGGGHRRVGAPGGQRPVRRRPRRRRRLLEAQGAPISRGRRSALAAAGLTALLAAGCGGGRLSHRDFVKRADAICSAYKAQTKPIVTPRSYDAIVRWGKQTLPLYAAALRKLSDLHPPAADDAEVQAWLASDRKVQKATRDLVVAAQRRDYPSVTAAASRAQLAGSASRAAASELGLQVCGSLTSR